MTEKTKKIIKVFTAVFVGASALVGVFFGGVYYGYKNIPSIEKVSGLSNKETGKPSDVDFSLFWDTWDDLENTYVGRSSLDRKTMVYGAISGMVKSLNDPYTIFLDPKEAKKFKDDVSGSFEGIGAEIGIRKNVLTIIAPLKDTPAEHAGLRAGDKILKIDDTITIDLTVDEAVSLIRGQKGTEVILTISRDGFEKAKEIGLTPEQNLGRGRLIDLLYKKL